MELLTHDLILKTNDKSKIDSEKAKIKVITHERHIEGIKKLVCLGRVDGKINKEILLYRVIGWKW